jgi:hypothetical protein
LDKLRTRANEQLRGGLLTTILNSPVCLGCWRKKGTHTNRKIGFTGVPWKWPFLFFYSFPVRFSLHNPVGRVGLAIIFFLFLLELNSRRSSGTCPLVLTVLFVKNFGGNTHHVTHYFQYLSYYIISYFLFLLLLLQQQDAKVAFILQI